MFSSTRLRQLRKNKRMTQQALADTLQVARNTVITWESGRFTPDAGNIARLSQLLGVSSAYLMGYEDVIDNNFVESKSSTGRGKSPEEQKDQLSEEIDFALGPTEEEDHIDSIRNIAMKIFDAQQLITAAIKQIEKTERTAEDNEVLDWQLKYLEDHVGVARQVL